MTEAITRRKWKRWVLGAALVIVAVPLIGMLILSAGLTDDYIRRSIVEQIATLTNGKAELRAFHFNPWRLRVVLSDFTIRGREPAGTPPFFHADRIEVGVRIDSFWGRKVSVGDVEVSRPAVHVRVEQDGSINVPITPRPTQGKPFRQRIFDVAVRRLRLESSRVDGEDEFLQLAGAKSDLPDRHVDDRRLVDFEFAEIMHGHSRAR